MLKTIFKILIVIFIIGLIFVGVMWAMQPTKPLGKEQIPIASADGKELEKAKGEASKLLGKVKLPLAKKEDEEKGINKKPQKSSLKKNDAGAEKVEQKNDSTYKFPKELTTDRLTYTLHIDAFLFKEYADQLIEDLKRKNYPAYGISIWGDDRQLWHAVRIGRYLDHEMADKKLADFNLKERRSARVINLGTLEFFPPAYLKPEKTADKTPRENTDSKKNIGKKRRS